MEFIGIVIFWIFLIIGVTIIPFGLGGTFLIVVDVFVYGLLTKFEKITLLFSILLLSIALIVELIEALIGAVMAKKFGGSKWGMVGALMGVFFGAMVGTPIIPIVGTLIGGFIGSFFFAMILERIHSPNWSQAIEVGFGAFCGVLFGKVMKILAALIMIVMVAIKL
jgi:uncharacterized protein YqgC (DUF456 family)